MINILVVCTGNSCRSVMTEALLNHLGHPEIQAFSAGSHPIGHINAGALATLKRHNLPTEGYKSQSWEAFAQQAIDIVITVCDNAAGETCPVYLNSAVHAHWGIRDPAHTQGTEDEKIVLFERTFATLKLRVNRLLKLPLETLSTDALTQKLNAIGILEA